MVQCPTQVRTWGVCASLLGADSGEKRASEQAGRSLCGLPLNHAALLYSVSVSLATVASRRLCASDGSTYVTAFLFFVGPSVLRPGWPNKSGRVRGKTGDKVFRFRCLPRFKAHRLASYHPSHPVPSPSSFCLGGPLAFTPRASKVLVGALSTSGVPAAPKRDGGEGKGRVPSPRARQQRANVRCWVGAVRCRLGLCGAEGEDS